MDIERAPIKNNYRIYTTLIEVLEARGYVIPTDLKTIPPEQFDHKMYEHQKKLFFKDSDDDDEDKKPEGLVVYFNFDKVKITSDYIQKLIRSFVVEDSENRGMVENIKNFLVVAPTGKNGIMDVDKNALNMTSIHDQLKIQFFKDEDLMFNVLKHDLVPQHILLSDKQKKQLLEYYKVKESQLPKILHHDPVSKFLGLKRGQVVKIIRKSQTAGLYTTYRVVV